MESHHGHRRRSKLKFLNNGLDVFDDVSALEMLLFFSKPQGDVKPVAYRLIATFGGFSQVFDAPIEELCKVAGVGEQTATLIKFAGAISRRYQISRNTRELALNTTESVAKYMQPFFQGEREEVSYVACLDSSCKVIRCSELSRGTVSGTDAMVRKIVETALVNDACYIVIAHNHPGGNAIPSKADEQTVRVIADALAAVDVILADSLTFADGDYISMLESGVL